MTAPSDVKGWVERMESAPLLGQVHERANVRAEWSELGVYLAPYAWHKTVSDRSDKYQPRSVVIATDQGIEGIAAGVAADGEGCTIANSKLTSTVGETRFLTYVDRLR